MGLFFHSSIKSKGRATNPTPTKSVKNIHPRKERIPVT